MSYLIARAIFSYVIRGLPWRRPHSLASQSVLRIRKIPSSRCTQWMQGAFLGSSRRFSKNRHSMTRSMRPPETVTQQTRGKCPTSFFFSPNSQQQIPTFNNSKTMVIWTVPSPSYRYELSLFYSSSSMQTFSTDYFQQYSARICFFHSSFTSCLV